MNANRSFEGREPNVPSTIVKMDSPCYQNGPLVEVTLQSLDGILLRIEPSNEHDATDNSQVPHFTAAVAFAGSVDDMQVASSFVCPKTGNLMVESLGATPIVEEEVPEKELTLVARWNSCEDEELLTEDIHPHLSIQMPFRDEWMRKIPLRKTNRDSFIVKDGKRKASSLDESDCSSTVASSLYSSTDTEGEEQIQHGPSVVWSASNAAMPEIIELHISIKLDADSTSSTQVDGQSSPVWTETVFEVGIAHLVLFGSNEGTTVMDLPVKKNSLCQLPLDGQIIIQDNASLRIKVDVKPAGSRTSPPSSQHHRFSDSFIDAQHQAFRDKAVLAPIIQQLRDAEDRIARRHNHNRHRHHRAKTFPSPELICDFGVLGDIFATFQEAVRCNEIPLPKKTAFIPRQDSMGATTIDTAASLEI
jgi:hypothetical protein